MMICDRCGAPVDLNEATILPATTEVAARYRHSICHLNTAAFQVFTGTPDTPVSFDIIKPRPGRSPFKIIPRPAA